MKFSDDEILCARVVSSQLPAADECREIRSHLLQTSESIRTESDDPFTEFVNQLEAESASSGNESDCTIDDGLFGIRFDRETGSLQLLQTDGDRQNALAAIGNNLICLEGPSVLEMLKDAEATIDDVSAPLSTRLIALMLRSLVVGLSQERETGGQESVTSKLGILVGALWGHLQHRRGQLLAKEAKQTGAGRVNSKEKRSRLRAKARLAKFLDIKKRDKDCSTREACRQIAEREIDEKILRGKLKLSVEMRPKRVKNRGRIIEKQLREHYRDKVCKKPKK